MNSPVHGCIGKLIPVQLKGRFPEKQFFLTGSDKIVVIFVFDSTLVISIIADIDDGEIGHMKADPVELRFNIRTDFFLKIVFRVDFIHGQSCNCKKYLLVNNVAGLFFDGIQGLI